MSKDPPKTKPVAAAPGDANVRQSVVGIVSEVPTTVVEPSVSIVGTAEAENAERVSDRK